MQRKIFFRNIFISVVVFLFLIAGGFFLSKISKKDKNIFKVGKCDFFIEEARTVEERRKGLSDRDFVCDNCGMLFYFDKPSVYGFWMKDMRFDLDILWISGEEIIGIDEGISRSRQENFYPPREVDKVLEIKAGKIRECEIAINQKIKKYKD
ncbi:MAG: DUF192 domain-containing protein [Candidatus Moraniibacteriota bacterium]